MFDAGKIHAGRMSSGERTTVAAMPPDGSPSRSAWLAISALWMRPDVRELPDLGIRRQERRRDRDGGAPQPVLQLQGIGHGLATKMIVGNKICLTGLGSDDLDGIENFVEFVR